MKIVKLLAIALVFAFVVVRAYAEETSGATYISPNGKVCDEFIGFLNEQEYIDHTHQYADKDTIYDPEYEFGVGVDLVVYQADPEREGAKKLIPDEVTVQNKYDFANENGATYIVAKYNIWDIFKKKEK